MEMLLILVLILGLQPSPDAVVQIADIQVEGIWDNWVDLVVVWSDVTIDTAPPGSPIDYDATQEWLIPLGNVFYKFTFERTIPGKYAIRWSTDGKIWSKPGECTIIPPGQPLHH